MSDKNPGRYILILVTLIGSLYFLAYYDYGVNLWDEGVPLSGALRMEAGQRPTRDFTAYPPGRYFLYKAALQLSGGSVAGPRIVLACLSGLICLFLFRISAYFLPYRFCWFPVALYLLMPFMYYYRFLTFFLLLSILMLITLTRHRMSNRELFLAASSGFLVIWFREFLGVILTALALCILISKVYLKPKNGMEWRDWVAPIVMMLSWLGRIMYMGGFKPFLDLYRYSLGVASTGRTDMQLPWPNVLSPAFWMDAGFFFGVQDLMIWIAGIVVICGAIAGFIRFRRKREWWILWGVAALGYILVIWRTGYGNLQRSFPPIAILATVLVWGNPSGFKNTAGKFFTRFFKLFYLVLFVFICVDSLVVNPEVYHSIGIRRSLGTPLKSSRLPVICDRRNADVLDTVNESLQSIITPGAGLVCLPFHTIWNFMTGEINPTSYEWLLPGMLNDPVHRKKMFHEFQSKSPDVILLNDTGFDYIPERAFSRQYPELFSWLRRDYYRWMIINEYEIFKHLPVGVHKMLAPESWNEIILARGQNRLDKMHLELAEWSVLWQEAFGEVTFALRTYDPGDVLKTGIILSSGAPDRYVEGTLTINFLDVSGIEYELSRAELNSNDHRYDEILIYIAPAQERTGNIVLRTECTGPGITGWIEPLIFRWPETKPCIDTNRGSN